MLGIKFIKNLYSSERLLLFVFISSYFILQLLNIKLPGLYADEALPACGSLQIIKNTPPFLPSIKIFNINFPLMLGCEYETALESYILLPFFWLLGINVIALRFAPILISAVMLVFMYFFLKDFFDKQVGLLTIFLLLINAVFLLETKLGLNSASMLHFTAMAALWSLFRWYKGKPDKYLYWGIFLFGLGISIRVWFLWFVNGMLILALMFNCQLRKRMKGDLHRYVIIGLIVFLAGHILFICYNLRSGFSTIKYIFGHFSETQDLENNFNYLQNLQTRLSIFIGYLKGVFPIQIQGSWNNRVSAKEISANHLYPFLFLSTIIWLFFSTVFNKTRFPKKRIWFILILFSSILLQSPFTLSSLGGPHLFILYPLVQVVLGLALVDILQNFKKNKILFVIISLIILAFVFLELNNTIRNNYIYFNRTGGTGNNSDSIYKLSQYLKDHKIYKPMVMDWGIYHDLVFLSQGKIIPRTFADVGQGHKKDDFIRDFKAAFNNNNIYLFHSPEFANRPEVYPIFEDIVRTLNKNIKEEAVFYQRDNRPVFIIYSVK